MARMGRKATPPVDLPPISSFEIGGVADWLQAQENMQRKPEATAKVLILAVKLYKKNQPWPTRRQIADYLQVSLPLIDVALSQRQATGHIQVVLQVEEGNIQSRRSVITRRFLQPSPELIELVARLERDEKRAKRRQARQTEAARIDGTVINSQARRAFAGELY